MRNQSDCRIEASCTSAGARVRPVSVSVSALLVVVCEEAVEVVREPMSPSRGPRRASSRTTMMAMTTTAAAMVTEGE